MKLIASISSDAGAVQGLHVDRALGIRRFGGPATWTISLKLESERNRLAAQKLEEVVAAGQQTSFGLVLAGRPNGFVLLPHALVTEIREGSPERNITIEATTSLPARGTGVDVYEPRWKVHNAQNAMLLLHSLKECAAIDSATNLPAALEKISLVERPVLQLGMSDWEFFFQALEQIRSLGLGGKLALTGRNWMSTVSNKTGWLLQPGQAAGFPKSAHPAFNELNKMKPDIGFVSLKGLASSGVAPAGNSTCLTHKYSNRRLGKQLWTDWTKKEMPLFHGEGRNLVIEVRDLVYDSGKETSQWDTTIVVSPSRNSSELICRSSQTHRAWIGEAIIQEVAKDRPVAKVLLPLFEPKGKALCLARLSTPYSGSDGKKGMNFIPEKGTQVGLAWSGRWSELPFIIANLRSENPELPSPSVWLESESAWRFAGAKVRSGLNVTIDADTLITTGGKLALQGSQGAEMVLAGGKVKVGKG